MHIEWEKKHLNSGDRRPRTRITAVLVDEADGRRIVARLGSIEERFLVVNIPTLREFHRGLFWKVVHQRLDGLELRPEIRRAVENEIHGRVPTPGDEWALWSVTCIPHYDCQR